MGSENRGGTEANPVFVAREEAVPKLVAVNGPSAGRAYAVTRATATVGRHATNDFVVEDPRVSGTHLDSRASATACGSATWAARTARGWAPTA